MAIDDLRELKEKIEREVMGQYNLIQSLEKNSKPVAPDNSIGRLTRMEAINSKSISAVSLLNARSKVKKLKKVLERIDEPDFGMCECCGKRIPYRRIMLMPESTICVPCAEKNRRVCFHFSEIG
tara:strand:+ start:1823 stop:2194 length:372 start_codon:yes stop_codon:yes gene_type:complete